MAGPKPSPNLNPNVAVDPIPNLNPNGQVGYHAVSGTWYDPRVLLAEDGAEGKAEALLLAGSFYLACKPFAPLRLGGALVLTPGVKRLAQAAPAVDAALQGISGAVAQVGLPLPLTLTLSLTLTLALALTLPLTLPLALTLAPSWPRWAPLRVP